MRKGDSMKGNYARPCEFLFSGEWLACSTVVSNCGLDSVLSPCDGRKTVMLQRSWQDHNASSKLIWNEEVDDMGGGEEIFTCWESIKNTAIEIDWNSTFALNTSVTFFFFFAV